ncbi:MAG: ATP-binding protein [Caldilineaceae bacterium]
MTHPMGQENGPMGLNEPTDIGTQWTTASGWYDLLPALAQVDQLLVKAVAAAEFVFEPHVTQSPLHRLAIQREEVEQALRRPPGHPQWTAPEPLATHELQECANQSARLRHLQQRFGLSAFEIAVIVIALAPEIDRRYELIFAYLQDHVARQRPSVDLILNLLCQDVVERSAGRDYFDSAAPLRQAGLVRLLPDPRQPVPSLLAQFIQLDEQLVRFLLGQAAGDEQMRLDERLQPFCQLIQSADAAAELLPFLLDGVDWRLLKGVTAAQQSGRRLYLQGPPTAHPRQIAASLAAASGAALIAVDLLALSEADGDPQDLLRLLCTAARLYGLQLFCESVDLLAQPQYRLLHLRLLAWLRTHPGVVILAGRQPWPVAIGDPLPVVSVPLQLPTYATSCQLWQHYLVNSGILLTPAEIAHLASSYRLWPRQIAEAVQIATHQRCGRWQEADERPITLADLRLAVQGQLGQQLGQLAQKVNPVQRWQELILPQEILDQLRELCSRVAQRQRVLEEWGFGRKLPQGKGTAALFAGPSGTGKSMAAAVIASELGLDLYRIDLAQVVSKYIGETEKNLDAIFTAAQEANAILLFDEADALFGKRSEVRDAHDRYANLEISYLLQKMEEYEGLSILTSNLAHNLDAAFVRRLAFTLYFPFPDEASRLRLWQTIWPVEMSAALAVGDGDFARLSQQFKLSGGNIKNIALAAAFLAAADGGVVTMGHLLQATRREYQKMGKTLSAAELGVYRSS